MAQASILIIEPEAAIAHVFAQLLEEERYTVACATSQDEARALLATHSPNAFGVVPSYDFAAQGPTPYAWLDRVRAWTRAPIVICTRSPAMLYADHQARGYAAVVEEPCDLQEVLDAVAACAAGTIRARSATRGGQARARPGSARGTSGRHVPPVPPGRRRIVRRRPCGPSWLTPRLE